MIPEYKQSEQTVSSLPSRSEVHKKKKKKKRKRKVRIPWIKVLVLLFILLPIGFYLVYSFLQERSGYNQKPVQSVGQVSEELGMLSQSLKMNLFL